jgi:hypothetical protein
VLSSLILVIELGDKCDGVETRFVQCSLWASDLVRQYIDESVMDLYYYALVEFLTEFVVAKRRNGTCREVTDET